MMVQLESLCYLFFGREKKKVFLEFGHELNNRVALKNLKAFRTGNDGHGGLTSRKCSQKWLCYKTAAFFAAIKPFGTNC